MAISDPSSALESPPHASLVFEDPAFVMPVALPPGPSEGSEASLGWAPVVPFSAVPSVPDFLAGGPLPDNLGCWCSLTPVANCSMASVSLDEVEAFSLSSENVSVLSVNLGLTSGEMFFVGVLDCSVISVLLGLE